MVPRSLLLVVLFGTSSGSRAFGSERMRALGLVRQVEARSALGRFGMDAVWFLGGENTHVRNVVRSSTASSTARRSSGSSA
jgi:LmbE family N-acetylglucosaminyl deacetylase